jgi:hypothetical protein
VDKVNARQISTPFYDKSVLEVVVMILMPRAALLKESGLHNESVIFSVIQDLVYLSFAKCTNIQLDGCQMESLLIP